MDRLAVAAGGLFHARLAHDVEEYLAVHCVARRIATRRPVVAA